MSSPIFISYRRSDSQDVTGRIYDRLSSHFDNELIFRDVDSIPYGDDFQEKLTQSVGRCQVLVAVIGSTWVEVLQERMQRSGTDWVRTEIATALTRDIPVIPLLVSGTRMPGADDLPDDLKALAKRNAAQARPDPDFKHDMERLIQRLEDIVRSSESLDTSKSTVSLTRSQRLELERLQTELDDLDQDYRSVQKQLRNEQDSPTQNKLERQLKEIIEAMDQHEEKIRQLRQQGND